MTVKILWFSRHDMSKEQAAAILNKFDENIKITKVNGTLPNVHVEWAGEKNNSGNVETLPPFKELIQEYDIVAIVAPIGIQQQILGVAGDKPVIMAKNNRVKKLDGGFEFVFDKWERLIKIDIIMEDFA